MSLETWKIRNIYHLINKKGKITKENTQFQKLFLSTSSLIPDVYRDFAAFLNYHNLTTKLYLISLNNSMLNKFRNCATRNDFTPHWETRIFQVTKGVIRFLLVCFHQNLFKNKIWIPILRSRRIFDFGR